MSLDDSVKINAVKTDDGYFTQTELKKMKKKVTRFLCHHYECGPMELNQRIKDFINEVRKND